MMLICPKCNTINSDDARFCENCGTKLEGMASAPQVQESIDLSQNIPSEQPIDTLQNTAQKQPDAEQLRSQEQLDIGQSRVQEQPDASQSGTQEPWKQRRLAQEQRRAEEQKSRKVDIKMPDKVKNIDVKSTFSKERLSAGMGIIIGEVAALILIIAVFCGIGLSMSSPQSVAKKYFKAMTKGDWDTVYACMDTQESEFLTKEAFVELQDDTYIPDITNYKVVTQKDRGQDSFVRSCEIEYTIKGDSTTHTVYVTMLKQSKKSMLFFPVWKVVSDESVVDAYGIFVPHGSKAVLDGVLLTEDHMVSGGESGMDEYRVEIYSGEHELQVAAPWCEVLEMEIDAYEGNDCYVSETVLLDEAREELEGQAKDAIAQLYEAAMKGADYEEVSGLFLEGYEEVNREWYDEFKEDIVGRDRYTLTKLTLDNFACTDVYYSYDSVDENRLCMWLDYDYAYDYTYSYQSWSSGQTVSETNSYDGSTSTQVGFVWDGEAYRLSWTDLYSVF